MGDWTKDRHAAARKACDAATSGPWFHASSHNCDDVSYCVVLQDGDDGVTHYVRSFAESDAVPENCRFIAAARTDLPDALDEIERLQGLLRAEMEACDEYRETHDTMGCKPERLVRARSITGYMSVDSRCDLCKGVDARRAVGGGR